VQGSCKAAQRPAVLKTHARPRSLRPPGPLEGIRRGPGPPVEVVGCHCAPSPDPRMPPVTRRLLLGGALLALLAVPLVAAVAAPLAVAPLLARGGATVGHVGWCSEGLCLYEIAKEGVLVPRATVSTEGVVVLENPTVPLDTLRAHLGAHRVGSAEGPADGPTDAGSLVPAGLPIKAVRVRGLTVTGAPLDVAPLTGEVWPTRALTGEGVSVNGDTVTATVPTPYGSVEVSVRPDGDATAVHARCAACRLQSDRLDPEALTLPPVTVDARWTDGTLTGTASVGGVDAAFTAVPADGGGHGTVHLGPTPFAALVELFAPLVPEAQTASLSGSVSGEGTWTCCEPSLHFEPVVERISAGNVVHGDYLQGPFTWTGYDGTGAPVRRTGGEGTREWSSLVELGPLLPAAVIAAEDGSFWTHPGYDLQGMIQAAADNEARGETWRGGSTLTQQLAKNLFLDGTRTYSRKLRELLYALDLERTLGKHRILELYLNVVEWGPGIVGARQAAETYFLKEPAGLLPEEAAWLASVLPGPRSAYVDQYLPNRPKVQRVQGILDNMRDLSPEDRAAAKARPLRFVAPP